MAITMAMPPANRTYVGHENVHLGFFVDLIFMVCQSTAKTAKNGSLENFQLYGITTGPATGAHRVVCILHVVTQYT